MSTLNTIQKQLARLGVATHAPALRNLVSNVRASEQGWYVCFDGRTVTGCLANQGADRAEVVPARSSYESASIKIAVRKDHVWRKLTIKQAHDDIGDQLDDLLEEIDEAASGLGV